VGTVWALSKALAAAIARIGNVRAQRSIRRVMFFPFSAC
jgi:hypothetical protein